MNSPKKLTNSNSTSESPRVSLTRLEIVLAIGLILLISGALYTFAQDAFRLNQALNLNLFRNVTVFQGIVTLQREVFLTQEEVSHLLLESIDNLETLKSRKAFLQIQINNLINEAESDEKNFIFSTASLELVQTIETQANETLALMDELFVAESSPTQFTLLAQVRIQLVELENLVKTLIDSQSLLQREEASKVSEILQNSQRTVFFAVATMGLLVVALIVVTRRALNAELQKVIETSQLKSQFLGNVSHDLRTPLNAIIGHIEIMQEGIYGPLNEKQFSTTRRILINATQLHNMVNNLLDRTQIEQGKFSLHLNEFEPVELLETTRLALGVLAETKGLSLNTELDPNLPPYLIGDVQRLKQIAFNLVSNAIKFTTQGSVTLHVFRMDETHWGLQVIDTGSGIPKEAQEKVFEPFWQVDSSATRTHGGSGLGLSIVKQLSQLSGGDVKVSSQIGQGSIFTVTLPINLQKENPN